MSEKKKGKRIEALTPRKGSGGKLQIACWRWQEGGKPKSNCKKPKKDPTEIA
jgi:hypothetical protein